MKQKKKQFLILIIIMVLLLSFSYSATKKQQCSKSLLVKVEKVKKSNLKKYKKYQGKFIFETVNVISPVEGIVTDIKVSEGDFVSDGAILIIINNNLSEKIKKIQAEIDKWKRILKQRKMWKVRSPRAEAQAEKKIKKNEDLLEKTQEEAKKYSIKASVNGKIKTIKVNVGDNIKIGNIVVDMVSKGNLYSELTIDENNKSMFEENKAIKVKNIKTGNFYNAKVKTVSDNSVVIWLENSDNKVNEPFEYCFKMFEKEYKDYLILSKNIVKEDKKGKFVYVLREKKTLLGIVKKMLAKKQYIKVIDKIDGKYVLDKNSGININDYVIISGVMAGKTVPAAKCICLRDGILVKVLQKGEKIKIKKQKKVKVKKIEKKTKPAPVKEEKKIEPIKKEAKKKEQMKTEKKKNEKKEIKKTPSQKIIKESKKENPFLTYVKNNKILINYEKIKTSHNYPNEFVIRVLGKNIDTDRLIKYINTIKYKRFCISKSKEYTIFSAYFIEAKKGKKVKKIKYKKTETEEEIGFEKEKGFSFKTSFGIGLNKSSDIENIASFLNERGISPKATSNKMYLLPVIEVLYNFNKKTALGLEFSYLFRNHNFTGNYSINISDDIKANYNFSNFIFKDKNVLIQTKFYYTFWQNEIYAFKGTLGVGMYFANLKKEKILDFSIKNSSDILNSYKYEETLNAKASGFLFSFGTEFYRKIGENINIFLHTGGYFPIKSNWKGDMNYNLPSQKTVSGDLYFVSYNGEKYLWILDNAKFNELNKNEEYTLNKPLISTNKLIFRIVLGLSLKF